MAGEVQRPSKSVLVTVGSTKFDDLIKAVDSHTFAQALLGFGFTTLIIQKGSGVGLRNLLRHNQKEGVTDTGLAVECFDFKPSMQQRLKQAALVISHAGSGTIFEALSLGRTLIAVPNPALMDNHQQELAQQLASMGCAACATPDTDSLVQALQRLAQGGLQPYERGDASGIVLRIDKLVGLKVKGL